VRTFDPGMPPSAGARTIPEGEHLTFKYRFLFHQGDTTDGQVADRFQAFVADQQPMTAVRDWLVY
jgi:hypothetical protein